MKVLGLDLETTGLDFEKDRIIEIGLVLYDTELKVPLRMYSEFIDEPNRPKIDRTKVAADITDEMLNIYGYKTGPRERNDFLVDQLVEFFKEAEYVVAHNGNLFDKIMLKNFFDRYERILPETPWLDTRTDIVYPKHCVARNLIYLAAFHGFVNPFPHRALFDVMTMLKILDKYDVTQVIGRSLSPVVTLRANVSYNNKDLAKARGFMWSPENKFWYKDMKECDVTDEWLDNLEFDVKMITVRER
ncbi:MAG: 3'-5' exonuclease [Candidatus Heimdallarchaeaceae archaeon]